MQANGIVRALFTGLVSVLAISLLVLGSLFSAGSAQAAGSDAANNSKAQAGEADANSTPAKSKPLSPDATGDQFIGDIAFDPEANRYLVVWTDYRNGNADVYGQLVAADGSPVGDNIAIGSVPQYQGFPKVAYSSASNSYLVVWMDERAGKPNSADIFGQRVSADGSLLGEDFAIDNGANNQAFPSIAYRPQGDKFLVVWSEWIGNSSNEDVFGRFVTAAGAVDDNKLPIGISGDQENFPYVGYDSDADTFLVLWGVSPNGENADIEGQLLTGSGALQGNVINVATATAHQFAPTAAYNPVEEQWFVVWNDTRTSGNQTDVYSQRLSSAGALVGGNVPVAATSASENAYMVSYNISAGRYMVIWDTYGDVPSGIYGRIYAGSGTPYAAGFQVQLTASGYPSQCCAAVAPMTNPAGFMVVYSPSTDAETYDAWGQRVGHDGRMFGNSFPIAPLPDLLPAPTSCSTQYSDVPQGSTYYDNVRCLACRQVISGYGDGTFKPGNFVTRAQLSKIVSNAAGYSDTPTIQIFQDIPPSNDFYTVIERLAVRGIISGYPCNSAPDIPCQPGNRPYFRPGDNATRGQIAKIISQAAGYQDPISGQTFQDVPAANAFYPYVERLVMHKVMSGYACDNNTPGLECVGPVNLPYFKVGSNATRGQISKMVANTFFPNCQTQTQAQTPDSK